MSSSTTAIVTERIETRAQEFARLVADAAMDDRSIVRSTLHFDELRPLVDSDISVRTWLIEKVTPAGLYSYEDAGMATGGFLAAQSLRYQVTGEVEAKHLATRAFRGVCAIYELGKEKCEGYFPKPYGGRNSEQISRDQYLYAIHGLIAYHAITDQITRRRIARMICRMADYWININYTHLYYNLPTLSHLLDYEAGLFLGIIGPACKYSKSPRFAREYERLIHEEQLGRRLRDTLMDLFRSGGKHDGATYFRQAEHAMMMKSIAADFMWDHDLARRSDCRVALEHFWNEDLRVGLDRETGLAYLLVGFDPEKNQTFLTEPGVIEELENPVNLSNLTWGGRRQTAASAQIAFVAAIVADRLKNDGIRDVGFEILGKLDLEKFRGWTVPSPEHLPPGLEWQTQMLNVGYLVYWQWAYWLGRQRKLW